MITRFLLFVALLPAPVYAQSAAEREAVLKPVTQLFDAMRKHDTAAARDAFAPAGRLVSVTERDGQVRMNTLTPDDFARALARGAGGPPWNEPIYEPEVRIEGRVATVWTWYDFLLGDKWSHCGVDAFQLAKLADGWKITQLVDTRQTTGCQTPAAPK